MKEQAVVIDFPVNQEVIQEETVQELENDFIESILKSETGLDGLRKEASRVFTEINLLKKENRWGDIIELCHPVEEKFPHLVDANLSEAIESEVIFALCQLKKFDEAIEIGLKYAKKNPQSFIAHAGLGFTVYQSLLAAKNREIMLTPQEKKRRIQLAHRHFSRAQEIRPEGVTVYYRQGILYKSIQNKIEKAVNLFKQAVENWEKYSEEIKARRHQERKNYIKSLYQLATCFLELEDFDNAFEAIKRYLEHDPEHRFIPSINAYYTLGKILFKRREFAEAIKALERSIVEADPKNHDYVFELLARCYLVEKNLEEAFKTISLVPPFARRPYVLWTEADILFALGEVDKAKDRLLKAVEKDRKAQHKALIKLVKIEIKGASYRKALDYAEKANTFFLQNYGNPYMEALFWISAVSIKLGDYEKAKNAFDELVRCCPSYPYVKKLERELERMKIGGGNVAE